MDEKKCEENMLKRREMFVNTDENYWSYKGFVFFIVSFFVMPFFYFFLCLAFVMGCVWFNYYNAGQYRICLVRFDSFVIILSLTIDRQCPKELYQTNFVSHMLFGLLTALISLIRSSSFWWYLLIRHT